MRIWTFALLFLAAPAFAADGELITFTDPDSFRSAGTVFTSRSCSTGGTVQMTLSFEADVYGEVLFNTGDMDYLIDNRFRLYSEALAEAMQLDFAEIRSRTRNVGAVFPVLEEPAMYRPDFTLCQFAVIDDQQRILVNVMLFNSMPPVERVRFEFSLLLQKYLVDASPALIRETTRELLLQTGNITSGGLTTIISLLRLYDIDELSIYDLALRLDNSDNVRFVQETYESSLGAMYVFNQNVDFLDQRFLSFAIVPQQLRLQGLDIVFQNGVLAQDGYICSAELGDNGGPVSLLTSAGERVDVNAGDRVVMEKTSAGLLVAPDGDHTWTEADAEAYCLRR